MVVYYKLDHSEPEYRSQMLARADGKWVKRADYETDLAAVRAEIERLKRELEITHNSRNELAETWKARAIKAEAERDEARILASDRLTVISIAAKERDDARSMLADAERDMRQRAAEFVGQEARTFPDNVAWGVEDVAKAILALPLKHADREGGV